MARTKGSANFSGTIEPLAGGALDSRSIVKVKADLTASNSFPYPYIGMETYVVSENKKYRLINDDPTVLENWEELGVIVDSQLDDTSENPIQNKVVAEALDGKADLVDGKVPSSQLPSYVDDIIDGYYNPSDHKFYEESTYTTEITGESDKIYVSLDTNKTYRWDGVSVFVEISESLALGETSSTAYRGDRGKIAYDDSQANKTAIGTIANLDTTEKTNLVGAINEVFNGKQNIMQVSSIPEATATIEGRIIQFIGDTTVNHTNGYFYKCVESSTTPNTFEWVAIQVQEGGQGGSSSLETAITASIDVGGIDAGDNFPIGTSYDDMWNALLNPTLYPTFVAPSASLTYSANTYYAVKDTISAKTATVGYDAGAINLNGTKQNNRAGSATLYAISTSGADTEYSDSNASSGSFSVPTLTRSTKGTIVITGTVSYAEGAQPKDSKGNDYDSPLAAGNVSATKTLTFIQPYYYGVSNSSTIANFDGLTENVTAKGTKTFNFTTSNQYMVFAYDSSYGNLKTILDPNSFDVTSGWTKSTLTVDGFTYYVYVANSPTTDTNAAFTFKY